jgi:hypothetical protein
VQVPADAHVLDVVFADSESMQSFHDDNGGLDYHIPIEGGKGVVPGLKVNLRQLFMFLVIYGLDVLWQAGSCLG